MIAEPKLAAGRIPYLAGTVVLGVGILVLIGWQLQIDWLKSGFWNEVATMKANSALCFVALGLALQQLGQRVNLGRQVSPQAQITSVTIPNRFVIALSAGAALIGLLTLSQYAWGWDLGIDQLLFRDQISPATPYPGRMGVNTALSFLLLGLGLVSLALGLGRKRRLLIGFGQLAALLVLLICLQALIGYAFSVQVFYRFSRYSPSMAFHTALTFAVLCGGMLWLQPERGFMAALTTSLDGGLLARRLLPAATLIPMGLGWLIIQGFEADYYDASFGMSLMVLLSIVAQSLLIWQSINHLNRNDRKRRKAEAVRQQTLDELEQSETRLQQIKSEYSSFFTLSLDLLCIAGLDGYFKRLNPAFERTLGFSESELLTQPFIEFVHPDDRAATLAEIEKLRSGATALHFENRYRCQDGTYKWLDWVAAPVLEAGVMYAVAHDVTNRRQLEQEIRESEARFKRLYDANIIGVVIADFTGNILEANDAFLETVGYSRADLLEGRISWLEMTPPEYLPLDQKSLEQVLETGSGPTFEKEFIRKDGSRVPILLGAALLPDQASAICFILDLTEQKQTEAQVRESEAKLKSFVDADLVGILFGDIYGQILDANDELLRIIGYSREDLVAEQIDWIELTPPEYLPLDELGIAEAQSRGACTPYEKEYIRRDGSRVPVLVGYRLLEPTREKSVAFILDITEQKQAEAALRESEARFRYMTDHAPMLVWISSLDQSGQDKGCDYFNRGWLEFTGRSLAQELGQGWTEGLHPDDLAVYQAGYQAALALRQPFELEYRLRRRDGEYRWLLNIGTPRLTLTGEFLGYIGSCVDIHDRKQAEAVTYRLNELLEQRVKERTAQLESTNKELESFSYSVSHDLRAPLRHISGFVELLQKRLDPAALDATSQRYLTIIAETTQQAGVLIDDLLAFSRMGRTEMRSMIVDLNLLVQEIQHEIEPELGQRQIEWQIAPLPIVQGDPSMLRLVVRNLIENAVKYTQRCPQAMIQIGSLSPAQTESEEMQIKADSAGAEEDIIFVKDNGIGFNMQYVHKLFGIFQRLHSDPNYEGTGIGLANVRRIIHRHGGRTWAEGAVNEGATFYFSLPRII